MNSTALREHFLAFFEAYDHHRYPSASLVPEGDTSLLFTSAGMVPFKDVLLGRRTPEHSRAVSCQRCLRAGGKHNDLENVGYTNRHHTFFEMLGNFSFGDYFKEAAIPMAWEFITGRLRLPEDRLWVSVYHEDDEAADIWLRQVGVDAKRLRRCDAQTNFWSMGETGPCGPCTEIYYDHGPKLVGDPPGGAQEGDRYVEIWNLVFTQYNRQASGELQALGSHAVDTGMGLERIAAVLQGVHDNYETDLFLPILSGVRDMLERPPQESAPLKAIADHLRACGFLLADGVMPAREDRGYVLRRIIRRAVRHGHQLGLREPFMHHLVARLVQVMGTAYPELARAESHIRTTLLREEERFRETLDQGLAQLQNALAEAGDLLSGEFVFRLYDTYGFPKDLTADIAREYGVAIDTAGFEQAMQAQRTRARTAGRFTTGAADGAEVPPWHTEFTGYTALTGGGPVAGIYRQGLPCDQLCAAETGEIVLETTPFYAQAGGQVGDRGVLRTDKAHFVVTHTVQRGQAHVHLGTLQRGTLRPGDVVEAQVDPLHRDDAMRNHSATHLLHAALRAQLGPHVTQRGSLVAPDRLRFDFSHPEPLQAPQLDALEVEVNTIILQNAATRVRHMPLKQAVEHEGALSLCGEKYDADAVRVLDIGGAYSRELCGGTHVSRAGDIGLFKIVNETGVAAGVRRIEALTGRASQAWVAEHAHRLERIGALLGTDTEQAEERLTRVLEQVRTLKRELHSLRSKLTSNTGERLGEDAVDVAGIKVVRGRLDGADAKVLRETVDRLKDRFSDAVMVLASVHDGKVQLVAGATGKGVQRVPASELIRHVAAQVGGRGGGRPDLAQAGGNRPEALDGALDGVPAWIREHAGPA